MESSKISKLTAYAILLLVAGLLFACKPIFDKKPIPGKEGSKEVAAAPAAPEPAPTPVASAPAPAEQVVEIEEVESIQSLELVAEMPDTASKGAQAPVQVQVADDGNDVVKITPAIMRKVQQALVNVGLNPGPVDGVSGAKTVSAIESFQKQNNIPAGKLNKRTLRALGVDF